MEGFTRSLPSSPLLHLRLAKRAGTVCLSVCLSCIALSCLSNRLSHGRDSLLKAKHRKTRFHTVPKETQAAGTSCRRGARWPSPADGSVADVGKTNTSSVATYTYVFVSLFRLPRYPHLQPTRAAFLRLLPSPERRGTGAAAGSLELAASFFLIELVSEWFELSRADGSQTTDLFLLAS